jgi:hypothetical protein
MPVSSGRMSIAYCASESLDSVFRCAGHFWSGKIILIETSLEKPTDEPRAC